MNRDEAAIRMIRDGIKMRLSSWSAGHWVRWRDGRFRHKAGPFGDLPPCDNWEIVEEPPQDEYELVPVEQDGPWFYANGRGITNWLGRFYFAGFVYDQPSGKRVITMLPRRILNTETGLLVLSALSFEGIEKGPYKIVAPNFVRVKRS